MIEKINIDRDIREHWADMSNEDREKIKDNYRKAYWKEALIVLLKECLYSQAILNRKNKLWKN